MRIVPIHIVLFLSSVVSFAGADDTYRLKDNGVRSFIPPCYCWEVYDEQGSLVATASDVDLTQVRTSLTHDVIMQRLVDGKLLFEGRFAAYDVGRPSNVKGLRIIVSKLQEQAQAESTKKTSSLPFRVIIDYSQGTAEKTIRDCTKAEHERFCFGNHTFAQFCKDLSFSQQKLLIRTPEGETCWCTCGGPRAKAGSNASTVSAVTYAGYVLAGATVYYYTDQEIELGNTKLPLVTPIKKNRKAGYLTDEESKQMKEIIREIGMHNQRFPIFLHKPDIVQPPKKKDPNLGTPHKGRSVPRLLILGAEELENQKAYQKSESADKSLNVPANEVVAWRFLVENAGDYGLSEDLSGLKLLDKTESLTGTHLRFVQNLSGTEIGSGGIVLTIDKYGLVTRVYNNLYSIPRNKVAWASLPKIDDDAAIRVSWQVLGAQELYSFPKSTLKYLPEPEGFRLVYKVTLHVSRKTDSGAVKTGEWRVTVDALTGKIVGEIEQVSTGKRSSHLTTYMTDGTDYSEAVISLKRRETKLRAKRAYSRQSTDGEGLVFDPDPLTVLENSALTDSSSDDAFEAAYSKVTLRELTKENGTYNLSGPWIQLQNFEAPHVAPTTTTNGTWTAKRGDKSFNDVMTYFHIDRSQRYIQSLGFSIQALAIEVDANGLNGDDNSHYLPGSNRLAFGHGGVDDNEDADVILHEYGHALTHAINPQWGGGDSAAIGEGFGDYWAETSSLETRNGSTFQHNRVFDWDASSGQWQGRRLDVSGVMYDPSRTYRDHEMLSSGVLSDELWSTPLYQAFLELRAHGVDRSQIDKIVLESMYGIGSDFTMRDLAKNVIHTAEILFPAQLHASVFEKHFKSLGILE